MPMPTAGQRLSIYLGESDSWQGHSLYMSILETLRKAGLAGATVTRGLAGFGAHSRIRTSTIEVLSMDLPVVITIVETPENISRVLALVEPMVREGLITLEDVKIIKYTHRYLHPLPADHPVSQIMSHEVTTVTPDTPAVRVVELLLGKLFKAVPVVDAQRHVVGIITDGDLLRRAGMPVRLAVGERLDMPDLQSVMARVSKEKTAEQIMTSPVVTAEENEALGHVVRRLLEGKLRRLPVVNAEGRIVGMISRIDVLRATAGNGMGQQEHAPMPKAGRTIGELMSTDIPLVHANDDLTDVLEKMLKADIKRVVVLDEQERAVGVITESDVVARVSPVERPNILQILAARIVATNVERGHVTARELMSENVLSAPPETTVVDAISLMLRDGRKRLIVVDEHGHPIGIVDRQTLMAASMGLGK